MNENKFDEIHVVSDLHFGGEPGFQIFNQSSTLAATIQNIASFPAAKKIAFVMNGDIVDFLAEKPAMYLDPDKAINKLERIFGIGDSTEKAFMDVWEALQNYVMTPNRYLVLVLGNHDVELALPPVVEWLKEKLSEGDDAARGRILVHFDGSGFSCEVGDKKVLCVHGNEVDAWNFVNYSQLLEVSQSMNRGQTIPEWDANAGTRMVIDIMNDIKKDFPMVDLLKPEKAAAIPVVLALNPGALKKAAKLMVVAAHFGTDWIKRKTGFLSTEEISHEISENDVYEDQVMADFMSKHYAYKSGSVPEGDDLLASDLEDFQNSEDIETEFLGPIDYFKSVFGKKENQAENMRVALSEKLDEDKTFDLRHEDDTYKDLDNEFGNGMHYLIAGHTHLERAIDRDAEGCYYYNSGTWIRLIHLTKEILDSEEDFAKVWSAFGAKKLEALDSVNDLGNKKNESLVSLRPTVVSIIDSGSGVYGHLSHASVSGEIGGDQIVDGSRFPSE